MADRRRPAWVEVDVHAARRNASLLHRMVGPSSLCAVVKADGYGHGAVPMAAAALAGGASWLAVALVDEGVQLREAGIDVPILLLSEPPVDAMEEALACRLTPTIYTDGGVQALKRFAAGSGTVDVHLKVDTGMHRVGADPGDVVALAAVIAGDDRLRLSALWTHLAVADETGPEDVEFTLVQLDRFEAVLEELTASGLSPSLTHVANSAGSIAYPRARRDMVRCGIALYGHCPTPELATMLCDATGGRLEPVLSLRARVSFVRRLESGERPSYGRRRPLAEPSLVATVPIGYADGVPRRLFDTGGEVLIRGVRRPLAGTVTMDQIMVDCGQRGVPPVTPGDEVVLIGSQGTEEITATEWANRLGTISYEVLCAIGARVPRVLVDEGQDERQVRRPDVRAEPG
ncbi:MAG: alanine racemase [Acidimicrobiales bacterium]